MAAVKILITVTTIINLVTCTPVSDFFIGLSFAPYGIENLQWLNEYCSANSTTTDLERWEEVRENFSTCLSDFNNINQSICHTLEDNIQRCSPPLVDYFEECLPEKSKDLPQAIAEVVISLVEIFCKSSGELLLETMNPCLHKYVDNAERPTPVKKQCSVKVLQPQINKIRDELPSKSEACQVGRQVANCWLEYVNIDCAGVKARKLFLMVYHAILSVCKEY